MLAWLFDRTFLKKIGVLAIPIAFQEVLNTTLHFIDTIMVSYIDTPAKTATGENIAIAATSFAGNNIFLFILLLVGITSGCSIFTAQYWGDKDLTNARRAVGASLIGSILSALIFAIPSFIFAEQFIGFFTTDPAVISMGASYLRILTISYAFMGVVFSLGSSLRSISSVKLPITISIFTVFLNTVLNWLLIFGNLGFPELGVNGAAIATTISVGIEVLLLVGLMFVRKSPFTQGKFSEYFTFPKGFIPKLAKTGIPVIGNEMGWALGIFMYNKVYASLGTDAATAFALAERVAFLFIVGFLGTSAATATLMGNTIGANKIDEAQDNSKRIMILAIAGSVIAGVVCAILAPLWSTHVFKIETEQMQTLITTLILIIAVTLPLKAIAIHGINGLMRSGGDTHYAMFTDIGCLWGIGIPLAVISGMVFHFSPIYVFLLICSEELIKAIIVFNRVRSGKWINRVIAA